MKHAMPEAVFFDWDGTLVNTLPFLHSAHNHVRGVLGFAPWNEDEFKGYVRYSSHELYGPLYGARAGEALEILRTHMAENHLSSLEVLADSLTLLEFLEKHRIPSGLVSNKRHEFLLREVSHLGWDHLFGVTIGAGFAEKDKPSAVPLLLGLERCGLKPGPAIWYVGDSETDMRTAQAAECTAILVRHHHDNAHLIEEFKPGMVFDDCASLRDYLVSCGSAKTENS